ncbi:SDR family oxidoreductase [Polynucleobacter paneuropaeus]|jgi:NAD(P)-dependent dehydrogenase (short-subunit alcohol dehydrogenase family)|uniref:3-oxoacyl-ACP reductase n=1 Tax=Polynucleobacter paneuropaeus TaxID=2527775 RepID=A0A2Z4JQZ8_9BURK|nr:SDR family oxidoreductase [Polynucleobacter paneuropaeus]AWW44862.1 3-oxoacyl-ACP reductase [Polynucleobacter paneuropaeus]AWW46539.1 3-oxoacyl-ACP reductase [Polynucleobacter paneuropaeus]AWW48351.1 3-oxoacyl-ACP reductase [Polynucleobacter paneuropaeus]AWW49285.1 3-oxoacyl-ACP reductase [Polynucleobacter paneuropaeus]MBT8514684.1 SDR family oxidoreductase [Polynucleobacter paneuropaeus]
MSTTHNKVALVTGAGAGIGKAAAKALLQGGYQVALTGRNLDKLQKAIIDIGGSEDSCLAVACDVGKPEQVKRLFVALRERFGRIDVLFNNAGMGAPAIPMEDLSYEQWMNVVNANLCGAFYCSQEAIRMMKTQSPQGGRIINNGSISAHVPRPLSAPYTATKHAITGLTKTIALDGRPFNIACGQIDIGNAATEMTEAMAAGILQADQSIKIEPRMDVDHVGQAVLHMAQLPLESNILSMTIMATNMPYVGRG